MARHSARTLRLSETCQQCRDEIRHDADRPVVRNVRVLGLESKNGRRYLIEAVRKAVRLYEGKLVNLDHSDETESSRRFSDRFGRLQNVRADEGGIRADLAYNPAHPMAESFRWWADNDPGAIGLSHNATGRGEEREDGTLVIDEIVEVHSVDLVADPATAGGLMESCKNRKGVRTVEEDDLDLAGELAGDEDGSEDASDLSDGGEGGGFQDNIGELVLAIVKDAGLSVAEKRKKVLTVLKLLDDADAGDDIGEAKDEMYGKPDDYDGSRGRKINKATRDRLPAGAVLPNASDEFVGPRDAMGFKYDEIGYGRKGGAKNERRASESIKALSTSSDPNVKALLESLDAAMVELNRRRSADRVRKMLREAKLPRSVVTPVFVASLVNAVDDLERRRLIEDRRIMAGVRKPVSFGLVGNDGRRRSAADVAADLRS